MSHDARRPRDRSARRRRTSRGVGSNGPDMLLGSFIPGNSWLHRAAAGAKLLALLVAGTTLVMADGPWPGVAGVVAALALLALAGVTPLRVAKLLRSLLLVLVMLSAWNLYQGNFERAAEQVTDLLAMVLLSTVLTSTTSLDDLLDVITRALAPFRRMGVSPEKVALSFSMVLSTVPLLMTLARETQQAARARGLERSPRAWLSPFVIRSVAHARDLGDALHARGVGDD